MRLVIAEAVAGDEAGGGGDGAVAPSERLTVLGRARLAAV
jgi:hypothetical protein